MNEIKKTLEVELNRMVERMRHMGGAATSVGLVHLLLVIAVIVVVFQFIGGRHAA
jgi:hypothetical protein